MQQYSVHIDEIHLLTLLRQLPTHERNIAYGVIEELSKVPAQPIDLPANVRPLHRVPAA